mmetsp:Transcript_21338/g.33540  ORF Transcript_21338/g.33540 Transcript_21338/m.33540 type:complete len:328 (-) Transcript_21338:479-1462(-)
MASVLHKLKRFDAYQKPIPDVYEKTNLGGIVSLISQALIATLLISEVWKYLSVDVTSHMMVHQRSEIRYLPLNIHMTFPHLKCDDIQVSLDGLKGGDATNELEKLQKEAGEFKMRGPTVAELAPFGGKGKEPILTKDGCTAQGHVMIPEVGGRLSVATRQDPVNIWSLLLSGNTVVQPKHLPNVSHYIHHLSFGDQSFYVSDLKELSRPLEGNMHVLETGSGLFEYNVKVIPTTYRRLGRAARETYQYSVVEGFRKETTVSAFNQMRALGIEIKYDFSPIKVDYVEEKPTIFQFLTNLCAILGGAVTLTSLFVGCLRNSAEAIKKRD